MKLNGKLHQILFVQTVLSLRRFPTTLLSTVYFQNLIDKVVDQGEGE